MYNLLIPKITFEILTFDLLKFDFMKIRVLEISISEFDILSFDHTHRIHHKPVKIKFNFVKNSI